MPKMKIDEDTDIVTFSDEQMITLSEYFKDTNAETAFQLIRLYKFQRKGTTAETEEECLTAAATRIYRKIF